MSDEERTPAEKKGFVIGKQYRIVSGEPRYMSTELKEGDIVTFVRDDNSDIPWFSKEGVVRQLVIDIRCVELEKVESDTTLVDVRVNLNSTSTTFVIQKRLSLDEVAAVLKAAGV